MTHPYDPPLPRCAECDTELPDLDGDWNACRYTGRGCEGDCDCGRPTEALCDECENAPAVATINVPVPFDGTDDEKLANFHTHHFHFTADADWSCRNCDCKTWYVSANYPCGADIPRHDVPFGVA